MTQPKSHTTISIFGCGDVGATLAYTLILQSTCNQILLIDPKTTLLQGQVRDLSDATFRSGTGTKIRTATPLEAGAQSDIIVITAGAKQKSGETRLALLHRNLVILKKIFESMGMINDHAVVLLVANPVDVLTFFARKMSGLPEGQVLGTGTSLDSARLRGVLSERAEVAPSSIDAYVLGEHGDSQFIAWSSATIGTTPFRLAMKEHITPEFKTEIAKHTRGAAGEIIAAKGCTAYGIGNIAASICKYILFDSRSVRPLSFYQPELGCCLSMPAVLGRKGIVRAMPVEFDATEQEELRSCAKGLRAVIEGAEKELNADQELEKALEMDGGT